MYSMLHSKFAFIIPVLLALLLTSCDSTDPAEESSLSLSFATAGNSQTTGAAAFQTQTNHVDITEAKILIREVEFESDIDDDGVSDDSLDFETGPFVVNLSLNGSVNTVSVKNVPVGRYDEIEFDIHKPEDNETPPDPDFKIGTSGDERFSVIVRGTFDGQDFLFRSRENMEQEIEFATPITINEEEQTNITLKVDLSSWFVDENGNLLNPTNPENQDAIDEAIKRSFEAFEDKDEDGEDDD